MLCVCAYNRDRTWAEEKKKIDSPGTCAYNILPLYGSRCGRARAPATRVVQQRVDTPIIIIIIINAVLCLCVPRVTWRHRKQMITHSHPGWRRALIGKNIFTLYYVYYFSSHRIKFTCVPFIVCISPNRFNGNCRGRTEG